jgi:hypothetical protein
VLMSTKKFALAAAVVAATFVSDVAAAQQTTGYGPSVPPRTSQVTGCPSLIPGHEAAVQVYAARNGATFVWVPATQDCPAHPRVCLPKNQESWFGRARDPLCPPEE